MVLVGDLPDEILEEIFTYLDPVDDGIRSISRVSLRWHFISRRLLTAPHIGTLLLRYHLWKQKKQQQQLALLRQQPYAEAATSQHDSSSSSSISLSSILLTRPTSTSAAINDDLLQEFAPRIRRYCANLRLLDLDKCVKITELWPLYPNLLDSRHSLEEIDLSWCWGILDAELTRLCEFFSNNSTEGERGGGGGGGGVGGGFRIRSVCLHNGEQITDAGLAALKHLNSATLTRLDLEECVSITDFGFRDTIAHLKHLRHLNLSVVWQITDAAVEVVAENLHHLEHLDMSLCYNISDRSLEALASAPCSSTLTHLDLAVCRMITERGVAALSRSMRRLQWLNLSECLEVTDSSLAFLGAMSSLRTLNLKGCWDINGSGLHHLSQLSSLCLKECPLEDNELRRSWPHLTNLTSLHLSRCATITNDAFVLAHNKPQPSISSSSPSTSTPTRLRIRADDGEGDDDDDEETNSSSSSSSSSSSRSNSIGGLGMLKNLTYLDVSWCPNLVLTSAELQAELALLTKLNGNLNTSRQR